MHLLILHRCPLVALVWCLSLSNLRAVDFVGNPSRQLASDEGKATLRWDANRDNADGEVLFELIYSRSPDFQNSRVHYRGPDRSTTITGLTEGEHFYRIRVVSPGASASEWSGPFTVKVQYPSKTAVGILMALGLMAFIATVTAVLVGHRTTQTTGRSRT